MRVGVADRGHHAALVESGDVVAGTVLLGCQRALDDAAARLLLPAIEDLNVRVDEKGRVLGAHVRRGKEGALEEDAGDARTAEVVVAALIGLCDGGTGAGDVVD